MRHSRTLLREVWNPRQIGNQEIIAGDCLQVLGQIAPASIDVVVTSPPYNLDLPYTTYDDTRVEPDYLDWMVEVATCVKRVMKPKASFFLNITGSGSRPWAPFELITRLRNHFFLQNHIVWVKSIGIGADSTGHFKPIAGKRFTHHNHEHIFHLTIDGDVEIDRLSIGLPFRDKSNIARWGHKRDLRCRGNTWFIPYKTVRSKAQKYFHPGTFPVELPLWCIYLHGVASARVLDPFVGSGTTLVAAQMARAQGIGIDVDENYLATAFDRIARTVEGSLDIVLSEKEAEELLKQDPARAKDGGYQGFLVKLQNKLNKTTRHLHLDEDDLERIPRYAFDYGQGGWEGSLKAIFQRHLGPKLGRD
jgi:site-specific DNA-methyltransferase (adenine-specific)